MTYFLLFSRPLSSSMQTRKVNPHTALPTPNSWIVPWLHSLWFSALLISLKTHFFLSSLLLFSSQIFYKWTKLFLFNKTFHLCALEKFIHYCWKLFRNFGFYSSNSKFLIIDITVCLYINTSFNKINFPICLNRYRHVESSLGNSRNAYLSPKVADFMASLTFWKLLRHLVNCLLVKF